MQRAWIERHWPIIVGSLAAAAGVALALSIWVTTASTHAPLTRNTAAITDPEARGAVYFHSDDFGGLSATALETHALPWKLSAAALMVAAQRKDPTLSLTQTDLRRQFQRFGFLSPRDVANWPAAAARPAAALPLGITAGDLSILPGLPVEVSNLGCAACHSGVTYDSHGRPDIYRAWLGLPNTSLDLEAYTLAVYDAYRVSLDDPDALMQAVKTLFPDVSPAERFTLRHMVLPRVRARMKELQPQGRPLPFPSGGPGVTNGVAALKLALDVPMQDGGKGETGVTSIPDLGYRTWRTSLLYDGAYAPDAATRQAPMTAGGITPKHLAAQATIATFFSVPSMGVKPKVTLRNQAKAEAVFAFLQTYRAPPFPGDIDTASAKRGGTIYAKTCASCHGSYADNAPHAALVSFPNWIGDVGTDPERARAFNPELARAVNASPYRDKMVAQATGRYVAPPLSGLWATAPYLHNGSVPTIAALLDPRARPGRFLTGGHRLDYIRLGIDLTRDGSYPVGYVPWSVPAAVDVHSPGYANTGHVFGSELTPQQKRDLINYLKLL
jgi:mono/diheme cytochrome c family protein